MSDNPNIVEVYPEGTWVKLKGGIEATITATCLRGGLVEYECTWFDGRKLVKEWLPECLIEARNQSKEIGFKMKELAGE